MVLGVIALIPFAANQALDLTYAVARKPPPAATAILGVARWWWLLPLVIVVVLLLAVLWNGVSQFVRTRRATGLTRAVVALLREAPQEEGTRNLRQLIDKGRVFGPKTEYLSYSCAMRRELTELRGDIISYVAAARKSGGPKLKPFTVLIWGPPGSGKSFLVEELARAASIDGCSPTVLEANLALMRSEDDMVCHLEECRKQAERLDVPFVLFDEVDSRLPADATFQRLLAPTWDGKFYDGSHLMRLGPCVLFFGCSFDLHLAASMWAGWHWLRGRPKEMRAARLAGIRHFFEGKHKGRDFLDRMLRVICLTEVNETESRGPEYLDVPAKTLIAMTAVQIRKQFIVAATKADVLAALALLPGTTAREITKRVRRCRRPSGRKPEEEVFDMDWLPADLHERCTEIADQDLLRDIRSKRGAIAHGGGTKGVTLDLSRP
jgi:hypothetical protein